MNDSSSGDHNFSIEADSFYAKFIDDGFAVKKDFLPASLVDEFSKYAKFVFTVIFTRLHANGHTSFPYDSKTDQDGSLVYAMGSGVKNGFREIVMRSPGRYEVSLLARQESDLESALLRKLIGEVRKIDPKIIDETSWEDVKVCNVSFVISTPQSTEQAWHSDGGHVSLHEHLSCHVCNIFFPLLDISMDMGPTQIRPGTHVMTRKLAPMMLAAKARGTLRPPTTPLLRKGDALAFDYRVLHRGLANSSSSNRTILVVTIAKTWFEDIVNFPARSMYGSTRF